MADKLKQLARRIQRVSGWPYQRVHNHLTQPGHQALACDWCKQMLALAEAGDADGRIAPTPAERQAQRQLLPQLTYEGEPFAALRRPQKQIASSGANLCPPDLGPYEWVERDGAMELVDAKGRRYAAMSKQSYEALKAEALKEKP